MLMLAVSSSPTAAHVGVRKLVAIAAGIAAVGFAGSFAGSWIPSLWGDEAASVLSATRPVPSLLAMVLHVDIVHAAYYLGLHMWVLLFGASPLSVRLPSALAAGVCAGTVAWMGGRARSPRFAVAAGLFAAILPRLTYAGEEARSYSSDAALAALLCAIVLEIVLQRTTARRWWIAYTAVLIVGTYAFLYLALMTLAVGVFLALRPATRIHLRRWLFCSLIAAVAALPLLVIAATQTRQIAYLAARNAASPEAVLVQMWFSAPLFALIGWALIVVAAVGMLRDARFPSRSRVGSLDLLALAWLVIPMGLLVAVNPVLPGYTARYGTYAAPAAAVLMASGVTRLATIIDGARDRTIAGSVLVAVVLTAAVPAWAAQRTPFAKNQSDWNQIASVIHDDSRPGDAIVFDESTRPSRRPRLAMDTDPAAFAAVRDVTLSSPYADNRTWHDTTLGIDAAERLGRFRNVQRIWLVEYRAGARVDSWGEASLRRLGFRLVGSVLDHRSVIVLYAKAGIMTRAPAAG